MMTLEQAKARLQIHAYSHPDAESDPEIDLAMERGFLGSLRPYTGLDAKNFEGVMNALECLAPRFQEESLDKEVVQSLWSICNLSRAWGLDPNGMLLRNSLITEADQKTLAGWIRQISWTVEWLLMGDTVEAFKDWKDG